MVLKIIENVIIGVNDYILVIESDGCCWVIWELVIVYFYKKYWFNIIVMICDNGIFYYCNMVSFYYLDEEVLKYIDYDLDVKIFIDGEKCFLDVEEYECYKCKMNYFDDLDYILKEYVKIFVDWINNGWGFFLEVYVNIWYKCYVELKNW